MTHLGTLLVGKQVFRTRKIFVLHHLQAWLKAHLLQPLLVSKQVWPKGKDSVCKVGRRKSNHFHRRNFPNRVGSKTDLKVRLLNWVQITWLKFTWKSDYLIESGLTERNATDWKRMITIIKNCNQSLSGNNRSQNWSKL